MPLNTFNLPGKNVPADKQLAMMRNYLENLKDDIESDLYNIDWNNFSKPLREKLEGLDKELIAQGDVVNSIQANYVSTQYLESEYVYAGAIQCNQIQAGTLNSGVIYSGTIAADKVTAGTLQSGVVYAGSLTASQITSGTISTQLLDVATITAGCVNSDLFEGNYIKANYIDAATIRAGCVNADLFEGNYIKTNYISSDIMRTSDFTATNISAKYTSSGTTAFEYLNCNHLQPWDSGYDRRVSATFQQVSIGGHVYRLLGWQVN